MQQLYVDDFICITPKPVNPQHKTLEHKTAFGNLTTMCIFFLKNLQKLQKEKYF